MNVDNFINTQLFGRFLDVNNILPLTFQFLREIVNSFYDDDALSVKSCLWNY